MTSVRSDYDVAAALLRYLRTSCDIGDVTYAEQPERIVGSYDTKIYTFQLTGAADQWSGPLILRVLRASTDAARARFEAKVMSGVAEQGYPAPRPLHVCEDKTVLGGAFIIMERMPGEVMLDLMLSPSPMLFRMSGLMAESQARLHGLDPDPLRRALDSAGIRREYYTLEGRINHLTAEIERVQIEGLRPALQWLAANRPPDAARPVICHDDFHPANILIEHGEVSGVIDWAAATLTDPAYDVAVTTAIFLHGPVDLPGFAAPVVDAIRGWIIRRYRKRYQELRPLDADAVDYFEALRSVGFLTEAGRHIQGRLGAVAPTDKPTAFADRRQLRRIGERIEEITGVAVTLPQT